MKRTFVLVALSVLAIPLCGAPKLSKEAVDIPVGGGTTFWMYYPEVKVNGDQQRPSGVGDFSAVWGQEKFSILFAESFSWTTRRTSSSTAAPWEASSWRIRS